LDNSKEYEDTIDVFLKSSTRNLITKPRPNDYDFLYFKNELAIVLLCDWQLDMLCY